MALALGNIQLSLSRKRVLMIAGALALIAAAAWLGWEYFGESTPAPVVKAPPPAAKQPGPATSGTVANTAAAADKLVADLLAASGLGQQLDRLSQQLISGVRQSGRQQPKASATLLTAIEQAVGESFATQNFQARLSAELKRNLDQKRAQALLGELSASATKRMVALEQAAPSQQELDEFVRSRAASRLSPQRAELVKRIDAATRASDLAVESAFAFLDALASGMAGGQAQKAAAVGKAIERQRAATTANIRNATFANLAFTYGNASDAELEAHAKFYEAENSKWFYGVAYAAILEEAKRAAAQAGERVGAQMRSAGKPAVATAKPIRSKSRADARTCLDLQENAAVAKCAEDYR